MTGTPREELENVAKTLEHFAGFNEVLAHLTYEVLAEHFVGDTCLEIGLGEGIQIPLLLSRFKKVTGVDAAPTLIEKARKKGRSERLELVCSMAEDYRPERGFDTIIMGHLLEHLDDGVPVMRGALDWVNPSGRLLVCESNADSLHRKAAVIMGLLESVTELGPLKSSLGQRRVYTRSLLEKEISDAGWVIEHFGGYFLKPLTNDQLEKVGTPELTRAYHELGKEYPEIAAEMIAVCRPPY